MGAFPQSRQNDASPNKTHSKKNQQTQLNQQYHFTALKNARVFHYPQKCFFATLKSQLRDFLKNAQVHAGARLAAGAGAGRDETFSNHINIKGAGQ